VFARAVKPAVCGVSLAEKDPARVAAMRERLHAWYRETGARFPHPEPGGPAPWKPVKE